MKSRPLVTFLGIFLALVVIAGSCSAGFIAGWFYKRPALAQSNPQAFEQPASSEASSPASSAELFKPFWQVWDIVHEYFIYQPVDETKLMQGAIRGMLESLGDEHTSFLDPVEYKNATDTLANEYEGIGAFVSLDGEYLTIVEPIQGSPAEEAGLLPGDQIIAVDGADMTGVLPELARQKVLGPKGTTVTLTIQRESQEDPFDVTLQRATIQVASVESEMLPGDIGYIQLRNFGLKTEDELHDQLEQLMDQNPSGLILDLRNNTGGYLETAIAVGSEFIADGVILYEDYGDGTRETLNARPGGLATDVPLIVLVNEFSASASELVAGAIQDYSRGQLVGVTTFGKGSVQSWIPLDENRGAVRVTVALWLTPKEQQINHIGLTPDVVVERSDEDYLAGRDPQLDKAIEILTVKD